MLGTRGPAKGEGEPEGAVHAAAAPVGATPPPAGSLLFGAAGAFGSCKTTPLHCKYCPAVRGGWMPQLDAVSALQLKYSENCAHGGDPWRRRMRRLDAVRPGSPAASASLQRLSLPDLQASHPPPPPIPPAPPAVAQARPSPSAPGGGAGAALPRPAGAGPREAAGAGRRSGEQAAGPCSTTR